jgi:hypothetical protein
LGQWPINPPGGSIAIQRDEDYIPDGNPNVVSYQLVLAMTGPSGAWIFPINF